MGKKSDPPPPPDYSGIARASEASAQYASEVAREQLSWAKEQYYADKEVTSKVIEAAINRQNQLDTNAASDRARYEKIFQPLEEDLARESRGYTDERNAARAETAAGRATADVSQQFQLARTAAQDRLESFGIDPSQTRAGALDVSSRIAEAASRAGAANTARDTTLAREEATGRALRSEAINVGRGYPGQIVGSYGAALASGQGGANTTLGQTASGASTMGTGTGWMGVGNQALGTWGNALNSGFQNSLASWKADQEQSSGFGQILGLGLGLGSKKLFGFAEGGVVPEEASPSRGAAIDDVAVHVRGPSGQPLAKGAINVGEFIVPEDVVKWKGEEHFQKLIEKSREAKKEATAKPEVRGLPVTPQGNPARQALPVG